MSRRTLWGVALAVVLSACALDDIDIAAKQSKAMINLIHASAAIAQTSETDWSLVKTGVYIPSTQNVRWTVTATEVGTVSGHLIVDGVMDVFNHGSAPATIGNIVVNLQGRSGSDWVSRSVDIADATHDDAATTANIHAQASSEDLSTFTENAASGRLLFMDADADTVFSLVPQPEIGPHQRMTLAYSASFDNNVLGLPVGTPVRAEVIVTFGNATSTGNSSTPDVDINGNGMIDPDEDWVRSVPTRHELAIPAEIPGNTQVTLTDTIDDITTSGTVTFTNPVFDLGPTGGTVRARVDGGTDGGTITNCAHLTGGTIDLIACDTVDVGSATCDPGTPGCGWHDGDVITYSQATWGDVPSGGNPAAVLLANYFAVYAATSGVLEVGIPGAAGFSIRFTNPTDLLNYLPALGVPGPLTGDHVDPLSTSAGEFGGEVTALAINVDFADAGVTAGTAPVAFGDLLLCQFTALPALNGLTVRQYLGVVETLLGGGSGVYSIAQLDPVTNDLDSAFPDGMATVFAQDHLFSGACP